MKKSRKLAWVVLGVVVLAVVGMLVFLSSLYGPWKHAENFGDAIHGEILIVSMERKQRFAWLPGAPTDVRTILPPSMRKPSRFCSRSSWSRWYRMPNSMA